MTQQSLTSSHVNTHSVFMISVLHCTLKPLATNAIGHFKDLDPIMSQRMSRVIIIQQKTNGYNIHFQFERRRKRINMKAFMYVW